MDLFLDLFETCFGPDVDLYGHVVDMYGPVVD